MLGLYKLQAYKEGETMTERRVRQEMRSEGITAKSPRIYIYDVALSLIEEAHPEMDEDQAEQHAEELTGMIAE